MPLPTPDAIRPAPAVWLSTAAAIVGLCAAAVGPAYMNHDAAWYIHMARVWLDGAVLYRDVIDTNPPLIVLLTAVPVSIARAFGLTAPAVFKAFVFLLGGASAALSVRLLHRTWPAEPSRLLLGAVLLFALFPFVKGDFGQREHLAVMLTVPFVVAACAWTAGRPLPRRHDAALGVMAGLGFGMKPHFVLAWLAIELCVFYPGRRRLRAGAAAAAATLLVYAAGVVLLAPEYVTIAREVAQVYGGLNAPSPALLRIPDLQVWVVAALAILLLRLPAAERAGCLILFAAATGFLIAALAQLKGWSYHLYPFRVFALLFFGAVIAGVADAHPATLAAIRGGRRSVNAAVLAAILIWSLRYVAEARQPLGMDHVSALAAVVEQQEHAESLALLSMRTIVYPAFPVVTYTGAEWVLRHNSLWFLPGLYADELNQGSGDVPFRRPDAMPPLERQYFDQIVQDLCARPPRLLVIEPPIPHAPAGRRSLDLLGYYRQDRRLDRLFTSYRPVATVGPFVAYSRAADVSCQNRP